MGHGKHVNRLSAVEHSVEHLNEKPMMNVVERFWRRTILNASRVVKDDANQSRLSTSDQGSSDLAKEAKSSSVVIGVFPVLNRNF